MAGSQNMSGRGPRDVLSLVGKLGAGLSVEFQKLSEIFENLERKELHKSVLELNGTLLKTEHLKR